jgi:hypothetical protein
VGLPDAPLSAKTHPASPVPVWGGVEALETNLGDEGTRFPQSLSIGGSNSASRLSYPHAPRDTATQNTSPQTPSSTLVRHREVVSVIRFSPNVDKSSNIVRTRTNVSFR